MSLLSVILQFIIVLLAAYLISYVRNLPKVIQQKQIESFKSDLQKEIEKLKISETNLHLKKIEKYSQFTDAMHSIMSDVKSGSQKTKSQHSKSRPSIPESYTAFAKDVIFYANDEIIGVQPTF